MTRPSRQYIPIIEAIFLEHYRPGMEQFDFARSEIKTKADELGIKIPMNLGDVISHFRYRGQTPDAMKATETDGREWILYSLGKKGGTRYRFVLKAPVPIVPDPLLGVIKVPDATPGVINRFRLSDEQALLAQVRYNRLLDIFTGITCYSLQTHLRTSVEGIGQVETDEVYVGIDRRGGQFVLPVQSKGGSDRLNSVQIESDFAMCAKKFPALACRAIAAQFMSGDVIALFEFQMGADRIEQVEQRHYRLVPPSEISDDDLRRYRGVLTPPTTFEL